MSNIAEFSNEAPEKIDLEARFRIMATIIQEYLRHRQGMATDLFRWVIYNEMVLVGKSRRGGGCKEHVVPIVYLRDKSKKMFTDGSTVEDVARFLKKNFKVVDITVAEVGLLNSSRLAQSMPPDWDGTDEFARLRYCGIEWDPAPNESP